MTNQTAPADSPRDNLFGVCHALGEIFGFNPLFLRLAFLVTVMLNAEIALVAYFGAGIAVLIAKLATRSASKRAAKAKHLVHA